MAQSFGDVFNNFGQNSGPSYWANLTNNIDPFGNTIGPGQGTGSQDPLANPYANSGANFSDTMYMYGQPLQKGLYYDNLPSGALYAPFAVEFGSQLYDQQIQSWMNQNYPNLDPSIQSQGGFGTGANQGVIANPTDPAWTNTNKWNDLITQAVQKVYQDQHIYVPPNVVKSIMQIESQGNMLPMNGAGAVGLMQVTANTIGQYDLTKAATDPAYSIWAGVNELAKRYQDAQSQDPSYGWPNAIVGYFSGHYTPTGASDGYNTDQQYQDAFNKNMQELGNSTLQGVAGTTGTNAPTGTTNFSLTWGGFDAPISQPFGMTEFARQQLANGGGNSEYDYSSAYSLDHQPIGHPAIDVSLARGTKLYAPGAGQVFIVGSEDGVHYYYTNDDQYGNPTPGPQQGELAVKMANGDVYILGHMQEIDVHVGDMVKPGDFVGYSGSAGTGPHVHIEYRQLDPYGAGTGPGQTDSGYIAIDPSIAFGGSYTGGIQGSTGTGPSAVANPNDWSAFMTAAAQGKPLTGTVPSGQGGFHDWLLSHMPGQAPIPDSTTGNPGWLWSGGKLLQSGSGGGGSTGGSIAGGIVNEAKQYLGVHYQLGAIPTKTQDPYQTGFDCSGFMWYLDQKYGTGQLPQGSHYQYQYAQRTGQLFTNVNYLTPGDLVFFDSHDTTGAGANLNAAGHVGMYIGGDQFISALNPTDNTKISTFSTFPGFIGAMHMQWR